MKTGIFALAVIAVMTLGVVSSSLAFDDRPFAGDQAVNMPSPVQPGESARFALNGKGRAPSAGDQAVNMPSPILGGETMYAGKHAQHMSGLTDEQRAGIHRESQNRLAPNSVYPAGLRYFPGSTTN